MAMPLAPPCQGLISCLYCDEDHCAAAAASSSCQDTRMKTTKEILSDRIVSFYEEALDRLPWEHMPDDIDLVDLVDRAGICVGLLDPVSNIVLNTVSLLPPNLRPPASSPRPRKPVAMSTLYFIASRSYLALVGFMLDYFGCLTEEQAGRYLRWADVDLAHAVLLAEYDLYAAGPRLPDPGSARTQASLKLAVLRAGHPAPDRLVRLTATVFPTRRLEAVRPLLLAGGRKLTVDDVGLLQRLLFQDSATANAHVTLLPQQGGFVTRVPKQAVEDEGALFVYETSDLGDGYLTTTVRPVGGYISSLRSPQAMESMQSACQVKAYPLRSRLKEPCGESCEHLQSLETRLRDTVHGLYLDAIALLPCQGANQLVRDILVAGHCYGPLEPVANIIVNSVWHNWLCPLPAADRRAQYDILDTLSMLRVEVRSLEGMVEAVRAMAPAFSTKDVLKSLLLGRCDITQMFQTDRRSSDTFHRAAVAAQHPLPAALALFHKQLAEDTAKLDSLRLACKMNGGPLSLRDIDQIADLVAEVFKITPEVQPSLQPQVVPELHKDGYSTLLRKRSEYVRQSEFFRSKVAQLLDEYAAQHPWEGKYAPVVICGLEKCGQLFTQCYRLNFMAGSGHGNTHEKNTLFFAEFWESHKPEDSKPDICCPLNPPYTGGRCYFSKSSARKIVCPDSAENFMCDVTAHGIGNVDNMIDADFVYFDSDRDVEFVKKVNSYYAENSFLRPTILDTNMNMFTNFAEYYPCT